MVETKNPTVSPSSREASGKTFLEFFAGIGLVEEGLRSSGWRCVYANDVEPRKLQMHRDRNGLVPIYHLGDVRNTDEVLSRITEAPFLATASFPCVDLSTAGHYRGFEGRHSSAFFGFVDVLKALGPRAPRLVMLENVVGFLTARSGKDFEAAAAALAELGYWLDAFVLDARWFVPQSRPRVFVIGMTRELANSRSRSSDFRLGMEAGSALDRPASIVQFMRTLPLPTGWTPSPLETPPPRRIQLEDVIDLDAGQDWWEEHQVQRHLVMMSDLHRRKIDALVQSESFFVGTIFRRVRQGEQRAEVRFDGLAGCLRTPRGGSGRQIVVAVQDGRVRMRWMSAREYARLQGVPDFPLERRDNQLLMGFADAVCVPVIQWIDHQILTPLYESHQSSHGPAHARQSHA